MIVNNLGATRAQQFVSSLIALLGTFPKHEINDIAATEKELAAMPGLRTSQAVFLPVAKCFTADSQSDDQLGCSEESVRCQARFNVELWGFCKIFVFKVVFRHAMTYSTSANKLRRPLKGDGDHKLGMQFAESVGEPGVPPPGFSIFRTRKFS